MSRLRTEITEIVTGLGMIPTGTLVHFLENKPAELRNVGVESWLRVVTAFENDEEQTAFRTAWDNGRAFFEADDGLRHRKPRLVEWKGKHNPPAYDFLPADLRVDHVYLVSCKYFSKVLLNGSPQHVFDRALQSRSRETTDWFHEVCPDQYQSFYGLVREELSDLDLPSSIADLDRGHRDAIGQRCTRAWPTALVQPYRSFSSAVAEASVLRWHAAVSTKGAEEELLWRMLRLNPAPYFLLGDSDRGPLRIRIATPFDWRRAFKLKSFESWADGEAGQPTVRWSALVRDEAADLDRLLTGHVEVRWSHGRFCGAPEAKVYLDTPHEEVPGYFIL